MMYHLPVIDVPSSGNSPASKQAQKAAEKREKKLENFQNFFPICILYAFVWKSGVFSFTERRFPDKA